MEPKWDPYGTQLSCVITQLNSFGCHKLPAKVVATSFQHKILVAESDLCRVFHQGVPPRASTRGFHLGLPPGYSTRGFHQGVLSPSKMGVRETRPKNVSRSSAQALWKMRSMFHQGVPPWARSRGVFPPMVGIWLAIPLLSLPTNGWDLACHFYKMARGMVSFRAISWTTLQLAW